ncbi:putative disease resistance RPP13-like protein 3 [Salvia hispanica]|uniref:putative disease resistance RPP13-like protein 3 n=1 Tax=Salvia hispanica TaxID=49212 RepID=UPI0020096D04|nr:putative disease resistance RPP13-like protein 3 [Salvia hispanica]
MADAAVEFLLENLKQLLVHHANLLKDAKDQVEKLENHLRLFKSFLKDAPKHWRDDDKLRELIRRIRNAVYEAEDIIDAYVTQSAENKSKGYFHRAFQGPPKTISIATKVEAVLQKIDDIYKDKNNIIDFANITVHDAADHNDDKAPQVRETNVVGFDDEAKKLKEYLYADCEELEVITIVGMPGLGKTTLAGKIFRDPEIQYEFPTRIWVYVSQEFKRKDIFLAILKEFTRLTDDIKTKSDKDLANMVLGYLDTGRFLLVMDDVWSCEDWDKLLIALPKGNPRGKVIITSRQKELGWHVNRRRGPHMLRFLTLEESKLLLQLEVFQEPKFPQELEAEGSLIAERCDGLPLAIVVIGGILVKKFSGDTSAMKSTWQDVSKSFDTYLKDADAGKRMEKIILLSYEKLPYHLRECFLYFGMFPEDYEISAWKLTRLWIAEGLIQQKNVSLEETAENYLEELINRNLVRAVKLKFNGKVKTCRIHDMLRDFCLTEAGKDREGFLQEIKMSKDEGFQPSVSASSELNFRRLCIHSNVLDFVSRKPYGPSVRSFVCLPRDESIMPLGDISHIPGGFKLLRVLDVEPIKFTKLPSDMYHLLHLRYLVLSVSLKFLPSTFTKLWNIQTLVVRTDSQTLAMKADILNMTQLRHFKTNASATLELAGKSSKGAGEKIQTLGTISPESCTADVFDKARNLKRLGIRGKLSLLLDDKSGSFESLGNLSNLEKLKLLNDAFLAPPSGMQLRGLPQAYKFPPKLRILTLSATALEWRHMSIIGSLDKLEVLKLKDKAFQGEIWQANDGGFRHLEILHIGRTDLKIWLASPHHFPRLKHVELKNCKDLQQIPVELAEVPSFVKLDVFRSERAAASARKIEAKTKDIKGNVARQFRLSIFPPEA